MNLLRVRCGGRDTYLFGDGLEHKSNGRISASSFSSENLEPHYSNFENQCNRGLCVLYNTAYVMENQGLER